MNSFDLFGNPSGDSVAVTEKTAYTAPGFLLPLAEETGEVETEVRADHHFFGLRTFLVLIVTVLGVQCFRLQVTEAQLNRDLAAGNSERIITLPADRGLITDTNGTTLAQNTRQLALAINPQTLPAKLSDRRAVYAALQKKAGVDDETISLIETNRLKSPDTFAIKTNLTKDESLLYKEQFAVTPGVVVQEIPIRSYANLASLGQLLGYVGSVNEEDVRKGFNVDQRIGKAGLEKTYDSSLTGTPGKQRAVVNASGEVVSTSSPEQAAEAGKTLKLSLDTNLQKMIGDSLRTAIEQRRATFGKTAENLGASVVILDPNNGAVLAMVSLPDYDANLFAGGISQADYSKLINDPASPLLNRTIQGQYPSGSVVKPEIAAGALQAGIVDANRTLDTSTPITIGQFSFPDWRLHPNSTISKAIAQSNDIFFYAIGGGLASQNVKGLGIDGLNKVLAEFGLGSPTGIDLPGESAGLNPGPDWKKKNVGEAWYIGDTYHQSIGQGYLLVTPLQMAAATAAIANGGTLYQPQLGWSTIDPSTSKETPLPHKVLNSNWISPENLAAVRQGMEMTTQPGGTAQLIGKFGVTSAGKTGTAEFGSDGLTHSWYVGYAPADHPKYAYAILLEGDGNVTEATESSEPVAEEILRFLFDKPLQPGQKLDSQALVPTSSPPAP